MVIVVIGGGAAGMMAALKAKEVEPKASVFLLEKNEKLGKKIFITGKGRGNLTNSADIKDFFESYPRNPRFLYSALYGFSNQELMELMESNGCRLQTERGGRVFPVSGHAYSITDCLKGLLKKAGVHIAYKTELKDIEIKDGHVVRVYTGRETYSADRVILATGGLSYPSTGSTGDGHTISKKLGIEVTECYPSLVHLEVEEEDWYMLRGLKLKNIGVKITDEDGKCYYEDFGELDFTSAGIGGPLALSASCLITEHLNCNDRRKRRLLSLSINLKPAMSDKELENRLLRDIGELRSRELRQLLPGLMPAGLLSAFTKRLAAMGVNVYKRGHEVSREDRKAIISLLRSFTYTLRGTGSFREAIVTMGGVAVKEINPKTMESKKIKGLYFAGELIDIDGYTGGFNMQAAFSTGALSGRSAGLSLKE